jgi:hypothetical protein
MAGYGGNLVVLLPNGISAFRFADGHHFDPESLVMGAEAIRPFCDQGVKAVMQDNVAPACDASLPDDLTIEPPGESVPAEMARFSGIWGNGRLQGMLCTALAVTSIDETGAASVVVSWGKQELWGIDEPGFTELPAKIEDGKLRFDLRIGWFSKLFGINIGRLTYWFAGENLRGAFLQPRSGTYVMLKKIEPKKGLDKG